MIPEPIFTIFGKGVHLYGVMIAVGVTCALLLLILCGRRLGLKEKFLDFLFYNTVASVAVGIFSAALFQATYNYIENPAAGFDLQSGMTFLGGLIGGAACFLIVYFTLRKRLAGRLTDILSLAPCCITAAHGFGRIGCFFAGCCYGLPTDSVWGVQFPNRPAPVHPTQLYEATFLFVLCAIMIYLLLRRGFRHNLSVYLIAYGIFRFLLEFVRNDHRGMLVAGISPSQFWSILMVILGVALIFLMRPVYQKQAQERAAAAQSETQGTSESV